MLGNGDLVVRLAANRVVILNHRFGAIVRITAMRIAIDFLAGGAALIPITSNPLRCPTRAPSLALGIDIILVTAPCAIGIVWTVFGTTRLALVVTGLIAGLGNRDVVLSAPVAHDIFLKGLDGEEWRGHCIARHVLERDLKRRLSPYLR